MALLLASAAAIWYVSAATGAELELLDLFGTCRNVTFRVKNNTGGAIDIKQVKYYNATEARWITENVKNGSERCNAGATCNLEREDLGGAENERLTKIKFVYKTINNNAEHETNQFTPTDPVCRAEKIYGYGQGWTITDGNSTTTSGGGQCNDVFFKFTNGRNDKVKIISVEYFIGGKWKSEQISGGVGAQRQECPAGATCTTTDTQSAFDQPGTFQGSYNENMGGHPGTGSNLPNADGADITKIKFVYKYLPPGRGAQWSSNINSAVFEPTSPACRQGRVYGEGQRWTLGGSSSNSSTSNQNSTGNSNESSNSTGNSPRRRGMRGSQSGTTVTGTTRNPNAATTNSSARPVNATPTGTTTSRRRSAAGTSGANVDSATGTVNTGNTNNDVNKSVPTGSTDETVRRKKSLKKKPQ